MGSHGSKPFTPTQTHQHQKKPTPSFTEHVPISTRIIGFGSTAIQPLVQKPLYSQPQTPKKPQSRDSMVPFYKSSNKKQQFKQHKFRAEGIRGLVGEGRLIIGEP
jgi:hypothetical protein